MLRTIGKSFGVLLLIFFLSLSVFAHFMVKFTEFDTLNALFAKIFIGSALSEEQISQMHDSLLTYCENSPQNDSVALPVGNMSVVLKCDDIEKSTPNGVAELIGASIFHDIYYKKYDCSFVDCLKAQGDDKYMVLLSHESNNFFRDVQTILWILTGLGAALILISVKGMGNKLKTIGTTLLFLGLTTLILIYITTRFINFPVEAKLVIDEVFRLLLSAFIAITVTGVILMTLGYALNFIWRKREKKK